MGKPAIGRLVKILFDQRFDYGVVVESNGDNDIISVKVGNGKVKQFYAHEVSEYRRVTTQTKRDYTTRDELTMREMVEEGCSIAEVAKRLDRTYAATAQRLSTLGIATRAPRYTPEQCERILTCADNQLLAREMNRTPDMIIMKRYKLKKAMRNVT